MIYRGKVLLFFSHTIKARPTTWACRGAWWSGDDLIDYERTWTTRTCLVFGRHD